MKKKDFESQLRKGLEGYEVAPPDDLWQRIEGKIPADSQLLSQKEKARKGAIVPLRRWVAVAAATLLVVGGVGLLLHQHSETTTARVEKNGHFVGVKKDGTVETTPPTNETEMNIMPTAAGKHSLARVPYIYSRREDHTIMADSRPVPLETYAEETQKPTLVEVETADSLPAFGPPDVHTITVKTEPKQYEQPSNPVHSVGFEMPDNDARLLATVHFGSMSGGANTTVSPVYMSDEMYSNFAGAYEYSNTATRMANNVELTGYEENREYQLPLKYGLSVSYRMTDRWAIQTGVNYMQQRTKLDEGKQPGDEVQLRVYWRAGGGFVQTDGCRFVALALCNGGCRGRLQLQGEGRCGANQQGYTQGQPAVLGRCRYGCAAEPAHAFRHLRGTRRDVFLRQWQQRRHPHEGSAAERIAASGAPLLHQIGKRGAFILISTQIICKKQF